MYNIEIEQTTTARDYIVEAFKGHSLPKRAIILGSGLGQFIHLIKVVKTIPYAEIPFFVASTITGHKGALSLGQLADGSMILIMEGRIHYYEGYTPKQVTFPIVVMHLLGITNLIVSCAAGGINPKYNVHDLAVITDHINFTGNNPLIGKNHNQLGPNFLPQSEPYNSELINIAYMVAKAQNITLQNATYLAVSGPTYETKAEVRAFASLGADIVGMSTVYEVILANYFKIKTLGIAVITNMATGLTNVEHDHAQVVKAGNTAAENFSKLVLDIVANIDAK